MMYSIIPDEVIFRNESENPGAEMLETQFFGLRVLARKVENYYRVERIVSTNPQDFLREGVLGQKFDENACNLPENKV